MQLPTSSLNPLSGIIDILNNDIDDGHVPTVPLPGDGNVAGVHLGEVPAQAAALGHERVDHLQLLHVRLHGARQVGGPLPAEHGAVEGDCARRVDARDLEPLGLAWLEGGDV